MGSLEGLGRFGSLPNISISPVVLELDRVCQGLSDRFGYVASNGPCVSEDGMAFTL